MKPTYHRGPHQVTARKVVAWANQHPDYQCPTCGMTLAEGLARWGANGAWEAGHIQHGDPRYGYHPQHRRCNRSEGAKYGNAKRREPHSEKWV